MEERVLSLDISTKTGYCLAVSSESGFVLEDFGQTNKVDCPEDSSYPINFVDWAYKCFAVIVDLIDRLHPDILIIEETAANSKSSHSQKILEWIHYLVARLIKETGIRCVYLMTGQWRGLVESKMNKNERDRNKSVNKYKQKNNSKLAYDINGKRIGKITKKHVAIRRIKELFGIELKIKFNDTADSILLAYAYHLRKFRSANV